MAKKWKLKAQKAAAKNGLEYQTKAPVAAMSTVNTPGLAPQNAAPLVPAVPAKEE